MTVITPQAHALIHIASEAKVLHEGYGIPPANADDARIADALSAVQRCRDEEHAARIEAMNRR